MRPESLGITLYDLPPYSPNLNPIERVWRVMNEQAQKNVYLRLKSEFIQAIRNGESAPSQGEHLQDAPLLKKVF